MLEISDLHSLNAHAEVMTDFYDHIDNVRKQPIHEGQIRVAKEFFVSKREIIQCQWGRNGGKTEAILFTAWLYCLLNPGVEVYIICPEAKQGKKIYWLSQRLQKFGPQKYIKDALVSDMRLTFTNGSSITIDGCENYEALRGIKPNLVIYDEFQHHSELFHTEVMEPNLLGKDSQLLVMGTPPKRDCFYVKFRKDLLREINAGDSTRFYMELPTWVNPKISKEKLAKTKKKLLANKDEKVWQREYEGKLVLGGEDSILPTWDRSKHIKKHSLLMAALAKDSKKLQWLTICDPGSSTCFGVLFIVHNPYTAQFFVMGELYEKDRKKTDSVTMWNAIKAKQKELNPEAKWRVIYDEAAAWFQREIFRHFRVAINPTHKAKRKQKDDNTDDVSLLKTMMTHEDCLHVSERCEWFSWEVENYVTMENGKYPDKDDHLIQCCLYGIAAVNFKFHESSETTNLFTPDPYAPARNIVIKLGSGDDWSQHVYDDSMSSSFEYDA